MKILNSFTRKLSIRRGTVRSIAPVMLGVLIFHCGNAVAERDYRAIDNHSSGLDAAMQDGKARQASTGRPNPTTIKQDDKDSLLLGLEKELKEEKQRLSEDKVRLANAKLDLAAAKSEGEKRSNYRKIAVGQTVALLPVYYLMYRYGGAKGVEAIGPLAHVSLVGGAAGYYVFSGDDVLKVEKEIVAIEAVIINRENEVSEKLEKLERLRKDH